MAHSIRTLLLDGDWDITLTKAGNLALAEGDYATAQNVANECPVPWPRRVCAKRLPMFPASFP